MTTPPGTPFWREAGVGPAVVCLHANASVSGQWRSLMARVRDRRQLFAPASYGAGQSPEWPSARTITLADEAQLIEPMLAKAGSHFALVGHSYGGAIALHVACQQPERVQALVLFEPTLFALIDAERPAPNDADGVSNAVAAAGVSLDAGDADSAARTFIDYWSGPGTWDETPAERRPSLLHSIANVRRWSRALFTESMPLPALPMPILLMTGTESTTAAHGVERRLGKSLPNVTHVQIRGVGHMGPITHPDTVNAEIEHFLLAET